MVKKTKEKLVARKPYLGDFLLSPFKFEKLDQVFKEFLSAEFKKLSELQKGERVNRILLQLIQKSGGSRFVLAAVIDFIDKVSEKGILEHYTFSHFELWLNQFSGLSEEENYKVRGQISGKYIPRDEYQIYFPVGMGKRYGGSHFVTAHSSPDLDTTIASFWGWVDAFSARVGDGLHLWNVPGGAPPSQVEVGLLFQDLFGKNIFPLVAKARTALALSSLDLMTQKGVIKRQTEESSSFFLENHRGQSAVILVDEQGFFLGDWRSIDVEGVRHVIMLLSQALRWFENNLHVQLISLFAKETLSVKDLPSFFHAVFGIELGETEPVKEFTEKQKGQLSDYLVKVLGVSKGLEATFEEFSKAMRKLSLFDFGEFVDLVESLQKSNLFDRAGYLVENRPRIFHHLEKIIRGLNKSIQSVRSYVERLEVALKIKTEVFGHMPQVLSDKADLEEVRAKMGSYPYLTVTTSARGGKQMPLGIIHATDLLKPVLGTVTLRDFCNREETKIPSYFEVISVIDHHKTALTTLSPPVVHISDSQSSNALLAALAFKINDAYSTGGLSLAEIRAQIQEVQKNLSSPKNKRILQRLLQKEMVAERKGGFFVDPQREIIEYLHFLYAIFDDTDLLTKVSFRDVECLASILNRLKSLFLKKETEILSFDDIPRDEKFVSTAVRMILQNGDTYSLYRKIYLAKEEAVEENLALAAKGLPSMIFLDTKEQNGCARVGQTKCFATNIGSFFKHAAKLRTLWYQEAALVYKEKNEIDLHLHMISTIPGAEDLFSGTAGKYKHEDELWIWIPSADQATEHLKRFLSAFKALPQVANNVSEVEFLGDNAQELEQIFKESFLAVPYKRAKKGGLPIAVVRFAAGSINSRKALISPCLPRMLS